MSSSVKHLIMPIAAKERRHGKISRDDVPARINVNTRFVYFRIVVINLFPDSDPSDLDVPMGLNDGTIVYDVVVIPAFPA